MTNHIADKVIVITGAGSGFGRLVAEMTAAAGAKVVGADINEDGLKAMAEAIRAKGQIVECVVTDITDRGQTDRLAQHAIDKFGAIDVLVNNAGIMPLAYFADHKEASRAWSRAIDVNIKGVVNGISAVYDQMIKQGRGHVVNISSIYGNAGIEGSGVYSATKAAVTSLSDSLRIEAKGKIKVTTVKPTGVPGTNLASAVVNEAAILGLVGNRREHYLASGQKFATGELSTAETDPDNVQYWAITPTELAKNVVYVIDQPWGISISDITVRASGDDYVY
ncbi:NADP-dependent 3-hydroxy acid dehydrogenase YdfG [Antricoccus suffuscus]|uniref:NADP-dependent 3-hydroxy acid dehydrogenase YdfG n=1 Tax=Antricoccus suffuscus TaxID=1629062 RepID=A0A2T0ZVY0_9ACTN|nr:SDR family oxidoreductase [Antricoccus suffuscus]PRZ40511.1 NADP-dependent 3-hydroxy acid dehydrogenase YdfG [Antricoccus suffuscus]